MAGEMPATVPFVGPKKRNDVSPRGKEDDNPDTGGTGWSVTGRSRRHERPNTGAQDVVKAHEAKQTANTPTLFTYVRQLLTQCLDTYKLAQHQVLT